MEDFEIKELEDGWLKRVLIKTFKKSLLSPLPVLFFLVFTTSLFPVIHLFFIIFPLLSAYIFCYSVISFKKSGKENLFSKHFFKTFLLTSKHNNTVIEIILFSILFIFLYFFFPSPETKSSSFEITTFALFSFTLIFMFFSLLLSLVFFLFTFFVSANIYLSLKSNVVFSDQQKNFQKKFGLFFSRTLIPEMQLKNKHHHPFIKSILVFTILFFIIRLLSSILNFIPDIFILLPIFMLSAYCCFLIEEMVDGKPEKQKQEALKEASNFS
mgnify:CR=1 FL=1|tara:strand:+ start:3937 stop:4743 length:807 start_codon:yes stop_codon:yes gene_type:complete